MGDQQVNPIGVATRIGEFKQVEPALAAAVGGTLPYPSMRGLESETKALRAPDLVELGDASGLAGSG